MTEQMIKSIENEINSKSDLINKTKVEISHLKKALNNIKKVYQITPENEVEK
jgi:hypothetical protein